LDESIGRIQRRPVSRIGGIELRIGKVIKYKTQQVKVVGFLDAENEITYKYKPQYRIIVQDKEGVKWVYQSKKEKRK
jgi:hypothetical protein